jgi:hypothetical protein
LNIVTFDPKLDSSKDLVKKLSTKCEEICQSKDTLAENYSTKKFIIADQTVITLIIDSSDEIIMFATLYNRKFFNNSFRTVNRMWKAPIIRKETPWKNAYDREFFYGPDIIAEHINFAKEKNINQIFASIEGGAHRYLKYISPVLEERTGLIWTAPKEMYQVCSANNFRCWQNITYTNIFKEEPLPFKCSGLTYEEMIKTKYN